VWAVAAGELRGSLRQLRAAFSVSVANSVDQRVEGESPAYSAVSGAVDNLDDEDDGLGYTLRVGKSQLPGLASAGDLAPRSVIVSDAGAVEAALQGATSGFRFLRNACAGSSDNQDASRAADCLQLVRIRRVLASTQSSHRLTRYMLRACNRRMTWCSAAASGLTQRTRPSKSTSVDWE
jgi:hypothetical protein